MMSFFLSFLYAGYLLLIICGVRSQHCSIIFLSWLGGYMIEKVAA